ncbi:unnamed protein product [Amoebophrya sp. A25]|nr:unnamed protein product [Amoebophrya sp. A25]|eukprot:GSA25T00026770001.1
MEYTATRFTVAEPYGPESDWQPIKGRALVDPSNPVYRANWPRGETRDPKLATGLDFPRDRREAANEGFDRTFFIAEHEPSAPFQPRTPLPSYHSPWQSLHYRYYPEHPDKSPEKFTRKEIRTMQVQQKFAVQQQKMDEMFEALQRAALDTLVHGSLHIKEEDLNNLQEAIVALRKVRTAKQMDILWKYEDLLANARAQYAAMNWDWQVILESITQRSEELAKNRKERKLADQTMALICMQLCRVCDHTLKYLHSGGNKRQPAQPGMPPAEQVWTSLEKDRIAERIGVILNHVDRLSASEVAARRPEIDLYLIGTLGLLIERWLHEDEIKLKWFESKQAAAKRQGGSSDGGNTAQSSPSSRTKSPVSRATSSGAARMSTGAQYTTAVLSGDATAKFEAQMARRREATSNKYMRLLCELLTTRAKQKEHMVVFAILKVFRFLTRRNDACVRMVEVTRIVWDLTRLREQYKLASPSLGKAEHDNVFLERKSKQAPSYILPRTLRALPDGQPIRVNPMMQYGVYGSREDEAVSPAHSGVASSRHQHSSASLGGGAGGGSMNSTASGTATGAGGASSSRLTASPSQRGTASTRSKAKSLSQAHLELRDGPETFARTVSWTIARNLEPKPKPPQWLADVDTLRFFIVEIERNLRECLYTAPTFPLYGEDKT